MGKSQTGLPTHIGDAIRKAWPDGVVALADAPDDSPFQATYSSLKANLSRLSGSAVFFERGSRGKPEWSEGFKLDGDEQSRSYCLLFLAPTDELLSFRYGDSRS